MLEQPFFFVLFALQVLFYGIGALAHYRQGWLAGTPAGRIVTYFSVVNLAVLVAWIRYLRGVRQEIWAPSKRIF